jgi:hypothetical protein
MKNILVSLFVFVCPFLFGQSTDGVQSISLNTVQSFLEQTSSRLKRLDAQTNTTTVKLLSALQHEEDRIAKKVLAKDSVLHDQAFSTSAQFYHILKLKLRTATDILQPVELNEYLPYFDTLKTTLAFLGKQEGYLDKHTTEECNATIAAIPEPPPDHQRNQTANTGKRSAAKSAVAKPWLCERVHQH